METGVWKEICSRLDKGESVAVATITTSDGSTPRSAGAKMVVGKTGLLGGTLGGGLAEALALREAGKTLADGISRLFAIDMTGSALSGADLLCGGSARIFIQRLEPDSREVIQEVCDKIRAGQDALLLTPVEKPSSPRLIPPDRQPPELLEALENSSAGAFLGKIQGEECLVEPLPARTRLILAGGGHVSLATARIADLVDFEVTVLDDRHEFANPARFSWLAADRIHVVPEYLDCLAEKTLGYPVTVNCCIAILTRGHSFDYDALAQALSTPAGYIGMIGSRHKRDFIYDQLLSHAFTLADLERVHSPIGLPLGGDTPAEIAVSIVAELVAARAGGFPRRPAKLSEADRKRPD